MDKVAYHFNKKKLRAKTDGKFLYYYPCNEEDKANTFLYGKGYFVIEVTEKEWEALFELDRFEYNNWHKVYRHNEPFPENEERLSPAEQQKWINRDVPLAVTIAERIDRIRALSTLTKREREVYNISINNVFSKSKVAAVMFQQTANNVSINNVFMENPSAPAVLHHKGYGYLRENNGPFDYENVSISNVFYSEPPKTEYAIDFRNCNVKNVRVGSVPDYIKSVIE